MDSPWTWTLIAMALVAMAFSYELPHAWRWIGLGGAIFFATTAFLDYAPWPILHPFLSFAGDAAIVVVVLKYAREDWEICIAVAFIASAFASLLRMFDMIGDHVLYASLLELCNAGALICITGTGVVDMMGKRHGTALHALRDRLHSPRRSL